MRRTAPGGVGQSLALQVGEKAPMFELPSTTGKKIKLSDYLGKQPGSCFSTLVPSPEFISIYEFVI